MKQNLLKVSIRQKAVYIPEEITTGSNKSISETTSVLVANASKLGFAFSEELLHALNNVTPNNKLELLETLKEITGVNTNWTPLVKEWNIPTGESVIDHIITLFGTIFQTKKGLSTRQKLDKV